MPCHAHSTNATYKVREAVCNNLLYELHVRLNQSAGIVNPVMLI